MAEGRSADIDRPGVADRRVRVDPWLAGVVVASAVAGAVLRWWVVRGPLGYVDLDEATAGIAASRFFGHPRVFFPAQAYGGTLELALLAPLLALHQGAMVLKAVPVALHGAAVIVTWRAARRVVTGTTGQVVVPIVLWCGSAYGIWESTKERGFYGATILLAAAIILLVVRLADEPARRDVAGLGLLVGIAAWTSPLLALVVLPAAVWLVVRQRSIWRALPVAAVGALVGAAPWLAWNLANGWRSLDQPASLGQTPLDRLQENLGKVPALVGLATPWDRGRTLVPGAGWVTAALLLAALVIATTRTWRRAPGLLVALVVGYLALLPLAKPAGTVGEDLRYLYPLLPALAMVAGALVPDPTRRSVRAAVVGVVAMAAVAVSCWGLVGLRAASNTDSLFLSAPGIDGVVRTIEAHGRDHAVTDLGGAQITFASDGRVRASSFGSPRFPDLEALARQDEPTTFVFDTTRTDFDNSARLERVLAERHLPFERERHGVWAVYFLDRPLTPWDAGLVAYGGRVPAPEGS